MIKITNEKVRRHYGQQMLEIEMDRYPIWLSVSSQICTIQPNVDLALFCILQIVLSHSSMFKQLKRKVNSRHNQLDNNASDGNALTPDGVTLIAMFTSAFEMLSMSTFDSNETGNLSTRN